MDKWDSYFMAMAHIQARMSKDPSTKVGAVIASDGRVVSTGYNGFPAGIEDLPIRLHNRQLKYNLIVHAEINAILRARCNVSGMTLYTTPFPPCSACALLVIQSGIARVVAPKLPKDMLERWGVSVARAQRLFAEAGVICDYL